MALYIETIGGISYTWNIGNKIPCKASQVASIVADGYELEEIKYKFSSKPDYKDGMLTYSIPMPNIRVVNWFGDIAKTIIASLN